MKNNTWWCITLFFCAGIALLFTACDTSLALALGKTVNDPTIEAPVVTSFISENYIEITWNEDPAADDYILERAEDTSNASIPLQWSIVYRGLELKYAESGVSDQTRYLYRLSKTRGTKLFGPSPAKLGVGSVTKQDRYEPNDTIEKAKPLDIVTNANAAFYRATTGEEFCDVDWYSIKVPAHANAEITVQIVGLSTGDTKNYLYFAKPASVPVQIANTNPIVLSNVENEEKTIYFKLFPRSEEYLLGQAVGGTIKDYIITIRRITYN